MVDINSVIATLKAECNNWIPGFFSQPQPVDATLQSGQGALYMYLRKAHRPSDANQNLITDIAGERWEVLYVGETQYRISKRHQEHLQQIGTCKQYQLSTLLNRKGRSDEIDWNSTIAKKLTSKRKHDFAADKNSDNYKQSDKHCRDSAGWSLATHVTWTAISEPKLRRRIEHILIGAFLPRLNRLT